MSCTKPSKPCAPSSNSGKTPSDAEDFGNFERQAPNHRSNVTVILVAAALAVLCAILILPALWLRGAADQQPIALLLLPAFGVALWVSAVAAGIGPQSLSNVIEVFVVVGVAIAAAYAKVLLLARFESTRRHAVVIVYGVVALTVWGLRQLMPVLAE